MVLPKIFTDSSNKNIYYIAFAGVLLLLVSIFLLAKTGNKAKPVGGQGNVVTIKDEDRTISISDNGNVIFKSPTQKFIQNWSDPRVKKLFGLIRERVRNGLLGDPVAVGKGGFYLTVFIDGKSYTLYLAPDDPIAQIISQDEEPLRPQADPEASTGTSNFFSPLPSTFSTVPPTSIPLASHTTYIYPSSAPLPSHNSFADCPFWVVSWCFYPSSPMPIITPFSSASPLPVTSASPTTVYAVPDCNLAGELVTKKAVISQTVCVKK